MNEYVYKKTFSLRLPVGLCEDVDALARDAKVSRNRMIEMILERYVSSEFHDTDADDTP